MLSIKNLEAGYGKVQVLHGISMEVPKGKVVTYILVVSNSLGSATGKFTVGASLPPPLGGMTGRLAVDDRGRVRRELDWAQVENGRPRAIAVVAGGGTAP